MTESEYFDDEPNEEYEIDIDRLRKTIYSEFMEDLETVYNIVGVLPKEIQMEVFINIMRDI